MEEAAAGRSAASVTGDRSTASQHKGWRESRHFDRESGSTRHRVRTACDLALHEAVNHGLSIGNALGIEKDPDFKSMHGDSRFAAIVAEAHQRAPSIAQKTN